MNTNLQWCQIIKTIDNNTLTIKNLGSESTVLELKKRIHKEWVGTSPGKQQLLYGDIDLIEDSRTLASYGVFTGSPGSNIGDVIPVITMYSLVNMLTHQGRFINLQRYVWSGGALKVLSPLAAVDSVESLQEGVLASSSLSMTSRDSFLLWQEISRCANIFHFSISFQSLSHFLLLICICLRYTLSLSFLHLFWPLLIISHLFLSLLFFALSIDFFQPRP